VVLEENMKNIEGGQKVDNFFSVVALKTKAKTTKSTTPTLQKHAPCITVCWQRSPVIVNLPNFPERDISEIAKQFSVFLAKCGQRMHAQKLPLLRSLEKF